MQRIYNLTSNTTGREDGFMPAVYIGLRMLIGTFILFVNGLTLHCIRSNDYLRTPTNFLVAGLALADFLAGFLPALLLATYLAQGYPYWIPICLTSETLKMTLIWANTWFIFWIALDRFIYISRPLRYQVLVTQPRVTCILVATWIWCIMVGCLSILGLGKLHHGMSCHAALMINPVMYFAIFVPSVLVQWFGIISCYSAIAWIAWRQRHHVPGPCITNVFATRRKNFSQWYRSFQRKLLSHWLKFLRHVAITLVIQGPGNTVCHVQARDWCIVRMMAMVLGVFFICTLPCTVLAYIAITTGQERFYTTYRIGSLIWWTQSWANPIIYAWENAHFRRAFKTALHLNTSHDNNISTKESPLKM